ncbi:MAG: DMT family transporter [Ancalomicrobiaceae bacterium]|nr:DMT family transporter [Ancalomicrobiaceae bacterium]
MSAKHASLSIEVSLLVVLSTLWGASYTLIKFGIATIPPVTFIAGRTLIAGALLAAILAARGIAWPRDRRTWGRFLFQALMNSVIPFTLIAWAEQSIDAGLAVILNSLSPVFTFLITAFVTRHEPVNLVSGFGIVLSLAGVALMIGLDAFSGLGREVVAQGAVLIATLCYAVGAISGKGFKGLDPTVPAAGSMLCGAALLIPLSLVVDRPWTVTPSLSSLVALVGLAVFSTALAFVIFFRLMQTLGSVRTTSQAFLRVPIGVGIGMVLLAETPKPTTWIGLVCVGFGVAAITLRRAAAKSAVPQPSAT